MEVYGDHLDHNDGLNLDMGGADDSIWQRRWRRLAAQPASWYTIPPGGINRRFTADLAAKWRGARHIPGQGDPGEALQEARHVVVR